jgi:ParB family chromosome partitioning protein
MNGTEVTELAIDELRPGRYQPRHQVHEERLADLAESIREQGVLQPVIVRRADAPGRPPYEIVAGARRWRAAQLAGLVTVPVIVRDLDNRSALAVALIENLQREDLNPIDQAISMRRLGEEFAMTHEEIAKALGRSRVGVTNFLRLLDLADDVKDAISAGELDMGHARALLPLDAPRQVAVARRIAKLGWSVRQVEKAVQAMLEAPPSSDESAVVDWQTRWLQKQLERELGEKVQLKPGPNGSYALKIEFADLIKLEGTLARLQEILRLVRETAGPRARERSDGTTA